MYELIQIYRNGDFDERVFPIYMSDAKIFKLSGRLEYIADLKDETLAIEQQIARLGLGSLAYDGSIKMYYDFYDAIGKDFDRLLTMLSDWNALTPKLLEENNFDVLAGEIEARIAELRSSQAA